MSSANAMSAEGEQDRVSGMKSTVRRRQAGAGSTPRFIEQKNAPPGYAALPMSSNMQVQERHGDA